MNACLQGAFTNAHFYVGQRSASGQGWRIYMGQCVSRKAGAVVAASGHHNSPSYRIMDKAQKQVSPTLSLIHLCDVVIRSKPDKSVYSRRWTLNFKVRVHRRRRACPWLLPLHCIYAISTRDRMYACMYECMYVQLYAEYTRIYARRIAENPADRAGG